MICVLVIMMCTCLSSRSLDGSRDTEIANLLWQPEHQVVGSTAYGNDLGGEPLLPKGDVAAFRCNVWSEHLGGYYDEFEDPASIRCVRKIRELAAANFKQFAADNTEPQDLPYGHLALYPYTFDEDGQVTATIEHFPDFANALVKGQAGALPNLLTG